MNRKGFIEVTEELVSLSLVGLFLMSCYFALSEEDLPLASSITMLMIGGISLSTLLRGVVLLYSFLGRGSPVKEVGSFSHQLACFFLSKGMRERILDQNRQDDLRSLAESLTKGDEANASYFRFRLRFFPFWLCITSVWEAIGNRLSKLRIK
jgi:hypothetical protein